MVVFACVIVDITLLLLWTLLHPLVRVYYDFNLDIIDEIRETQYVYGYCESEESHISIYVVLTFWKLIELIFGFYVGIDVSRIKDVTNILTQLNETSIQLLSILITFIIACITIPIFLFGPTDDPNILYLIIAISVLFIGNIVICLNLCPRTIAVLFRNDQDGKYGMSPAQRMEKQWRKELRKLTSLERQVPLIKECSEEDERL